MRQTAKSKGPRGERDLRRLLDRVEGVNIRLQPGSGSFGSRVGAKAMQGDLRLMIGDSAYRCEVKRRKDAPQVLERWLLGLDILAIRADQGEWRFYLPQQAFLDLLALAAEGAANAPP